MSSSDTRLDVVGIGSMVVDHLYRTPRILGADEKGVLLPMAEGAPSQIFVGGVVLNHLGWAALLGARVGVCGHQADDENGRFLRAAMDRIGIERNLILDGSASSIAQILVDDEGGRAIYMASGATGETTPDQIRRHHGDFIRRGNRLSTEVSQLPLAAVEAAMEAARNAGMQTVLDLDIPPSEAVPRLGDRETLERVLRAADLLKPAKAAARQLVPEAGADALAVARALRARFDLETVVVTDGEAGCVIARADFEERIPAVPAKEVVDTTGAGDAFLGGLLAGLGQGLAWGDAASLANACGAACVERLGAFPADPNAIRARVQELYRGAAFSWGAVSAGRPTGSAESQAEQVFEVAQEEIAALRRRLDPRQFEAAADLIESACDSGGRVHVTGVGKPEHVAGYGAGVLCSTGTPAAFLHATEAVHGSSGQIVAGDVVIAISNSGETVELLACVDAVRALGARIIAITGVLDSPLTTRAEVVLDAGVSREGGGLGLAPRSSMAVEALVVGALAAELETRNHFEREAYHLRHPAGKLGRTSRNTS